jgi:CRP/FNR family cyclic AMP-dependent transcriptional regulator
VAKAKLETVLAAVPLFQGLTKRQLKRLAAITEVVEFMAGHSIVREGDEGDSFYVVLKGQAKVTVGKKTVATLLPGEHFGEISLLDGGPRTASVTSDTPMTMLMITRKAFLKELRQDAELSLSLMSSLSRMLRRLDKQITR